MSDEQQRQTYDFDALLERQGQLVADLQTTVRGAAVEGPFEAVFPFAQALNEGIAGLIQMIDAEFSTPEALRDFIAAEVDRRIEEAEPGGPEVEEEDETLDKAPEELQE